MVGKTKMAAQVLAEEFISWPVAIPDSKTALAEMDAKDVTLQDSVIWLDDINRLIGAGGITDGALRRLATSGNVIVGTIRARAYDQLRPSDQLRLPEWDVLCAFEHVFLRRELSQREQERLASAVTEPDIQARIQAVGLGEYVGAARQVAEALELGAAGTEPLGYALVVAAADWNRCGISRPIPASLLAPLARPHLDNKNQTRLDDRDAFNTGLAWATRDINPNVALLQPAGTDSYNVYDYALDLVSAQDRPIPDGSWDVLIANAEPAELVNIGYGAEFTYNRAEIAAQAWRKAASCKDADITPLAALVLGRLLRDEGDAPGAKEAFQQAIDSEHANAAPLASLDLGRLLGDEGDGPGAKEAFQQAIDSEHANAAPLASLDLGLLLLKERDARGAMKAFQQAIDSEHANAAGLGGLVLGLLLAAIGDKPGAKETINKAIYHLDRLQSMLEADKDAPEVIEAFQQAIDAQTHAAALVNFESIVLPKNWETERAASSQMDERHSGRPDLNELDTGDGQDHGPA